MDKVDRLIEEAKEAARGHDLGDFTELARAYVAGCTKCSATVTVIPNPRPNEIDISGRAVALGCHNE